MKPILFNTEMVRAFKEDRKTATRRVVRPKYCDSVFEVLHGQLYETSPDEPPRDNGDGTKTFSVRPYVPCEPPYQPGDILYVRETWAVHSCNDLLPPSIPCRKTEAGRDCYIYRADGMSGETPCGVYPSPHKWKPSIHMPKEAARLFLRVKSVRVEQLQTPFFSPGTVALTCQAEGIDIGDQCRECIETYGNPTCISDEDGDDESECECGILDDIRNEFAKLWDSTIKPADLARYGWDANPWVWVIEFEQISKEEAEGA